jgi:hypothetical protein
MLDEIEQGIEDFGGQGNWLSVVGGAQGAALSLELKLTESVDHG